jgi:hypothetical protein
VNQYGTLAQPDYSNVCFGLQYLNRPADVAKTLDNLLRGERWAEEMRGGEWREVGKRRDVLCGVVLYRTIVCVCVCVCKFILILFVTSKSPL